MAIRQLTGLATVIMVYFFLAQFVSLHALIIFAMADSTMGKMMQKAGGMFGHKGLQEKGQAKREKAGYGEDLKDTGAEDGEDAEAQRAKDVDGRSRADSKMGGHGGNPFMSGH